ncbi:ATP-binding protein [Aureimonas psammosilenae]|uniref:ATP-binding protein n=1 Tax=Aureimonas psammosilenae TaxID=2495496 RepID=UPI001260C123|nr:ATP-binding protein [Aureimonas psammosilenae]
MSSAPGAILPELLALAQVRAARRGCASLVLNASLSDVLFADPAGRDLFGLSAGAALPPLLTRQLRSGLRRALEGTSVRVLLRLASGPSAQPVSAEMLGLPAAGEKVILLVTEAARRAALNLDPATLLADLGEAEGAAGLFGADGMVVSGRAFPDGLSADQNLSRAVQSLLADDTNQSDIIVGNVAIRLLRVEDDLVLALASQAAKAPEAPVSAGMNIAAIVGRWHVRRSEGGEDDASATQPPLRAIWGAPTFSEPQAPVLAASPVPEHQPAVPSDEPPATADDQPIDRPSVVTLPDMPEEEAGDLDLPFEADEEQPEEGDLPPPPHELPPESAPASVEGPTSAGADIAASPFVPRFDRPPARFVWQIDRNGAFRSLSPEFADAVGPRSADVIGRSFADVAASYGFDGSGEIRRLLERRDTWSGRTVFWPLENTDRRVPIDLAALPTYGRDRTFDGFRGFGIVRGAEAQEDPRAIGMSFARAPASPAPSEVEAPAATPTEPAAPNALFRRIETDLPAASFGRRPTPPAVSAPAEPSEDAQAPKVIRLGERRRAREGSLSETEEAAFRAIGAKLGKRSEAETPGALRFEEPATAPTAEEPVSAPQAPTDSAVPAADDRADSTPDERQALLDTGVEDAPLSAETAQDEAREALAALPLPILVQARDTVVFANEPFFALVGHRDIEALNEAGGLDTLFADTPDGAAPGEMVLCRADGNTVPAKVRMQRIPFAGRSSLLMTFETVEMPVAESPELDDLRREVGELKTVLDIATDGVVLTDMDTAVRAVNGSAQALFGLSAEEFQGRALSSLFAHESQRAVSEYVETLKNTGLAGVLNDGREVIGRVAQGGFIPLFITIGRLSDDRGWCVVIRDIAHWKRNEEELVNARRAAEAASLHKSRFLANITHELRTPLNAIIGFADVMASECFGPIGNERYIEYLGDIKRSGHHVLDLVNDLLDIAKIEAGKLELTFESVSLNEVLAEVVSVMQPQANRERVIVRSNLPPSVPPVVADRRTIRQIALNLLSNSVRFTPAGGQIIASTTYTAEGDVLLRVRDSGIGMTEREIEIALTPFQQVHHNSEERGQGTGLGLPLTKAMAEANRASFAIRSKPGEGTLVEIAFPSQRVLAD